jgi:hypothetical protein
VSSQDDHIDYSTVDQQNFLNKRENKGKNMAGDVN